MNAAKVVTMKTWLLAACAILAMFAFGPYASANPVRINFSGTAGKGYADLTLTPDPDASSNYHPNYDPNSSSTALSIYDPEGAKHITGASGSFNGIAITGVLATSPGAAPPGETLPKSFSWLGAGTPAQSSYDNLFYPDGSPLVCPPHGPIPYTFHGGFLDIFGLMFALDNGDIVGLWSDGVTAPMAFGPTWPGGLTYGLSMFTPDGSGGYVKSSFQFVGAKAAVPEPDFLWLLGAGVLGLIAWRRSVESRKTQRAI